MAPNSPLISAGDLDILKNDYTSYMPEDKTLYKLPTDSVTKEGRRQFVDLTIYHPKYGGAYEDHVPIDLAHFYCTMSQGGHPHVQQAWEFATRQPRMNEIGPLGRRAGNLRV